MVWHMIATREQATSKDSDLLRRISMWVVHVDLILWHTSFKAPVKKAGSGDLRQISYIDRLLGISVNIPIKAFCPPMCILFVCSKSCFYTFGRIDWVGWRLAHGEGGRGYQSATGDSQFLIQDECDRSAFHHQSILRKEQQKFIYRYFFSE